MTLEPTRFLSVCSGIEAASVAWHPLGWEPAAFSEIEPFPCAVLAHHYPDVPNLGDMTEHGGWDVRADVLVGGTPCQSFSVAGLRGGMADARGNLALVFLRIAAQVRPDWIVWENVPGVLSSGGGRDFGSFLGGLVELGYGFAYRVLDAQFFGVAQRRRRVFVVGSLGDWRRAAAVLFESSCLRGDPAPSREAGEGVAGSLTEGFGSRGVDMDQVAGGVAVVARSLRAKDNLAHREDVDTPVTHSLSADGFDASEDGTGRGTPLVVNARQDPITSEMAQPLDQDGASQAVVWDGAQITCPGYRGNPRPGDPAYTLAKANTHASILSSGMAVRRLTPRECERLQGFPDDYTQVPYRGKPAADGPRYRALGNSMAVPVMRWIGERIQQLLPFGEEEG